ncbi:MAG TPA: adenylate/guanylate cyclase domain-containing protein, partial [Alphaproteobacteria bacterium]|nr:adenylate/guanylate cyclase domain-containing protein [Alphaproteobacteria bacterium]
MPIWYAKRAFSAFDSPGRAGLQGDSKQRLRLWSGLVLMAYAATHLANHAVGLWSLAEMEAVRLWFTGFWRSLPGTVLLAGAASVHVVLALWKVAAGRTLRLPFWQWAQIALGLAIPLLLAEHVFGTRLSHEVFGLEDRYAYVLLSTWPEKNVTMAAMIAVVWLHGCLGVHYWARLYPTYRDVRGWFLSIAVLLPVLAYMGYASAGREVARLRAADPFWTGDLLRAIGFPGEEVSAFVAAGDRAATIGTIAIVVLIGSVRLGRAIAARRNQVPLTYPGQRRLRVPRGISVLEASQRA